MFEMLYGDVLFLLRWHFIGPILLLSKAHCNTLAMCRSALQTQQWCLYYYLHNYQYKQWFSCLLIPWKGSDLDIYTMANTKKLPDTQLFQFWSKISHRSKPVVWGFEATGSRGTCAERSVSLPHASSREQRAKNEAHRDELTIKRITL